MARQPSPEDYAAAERLLGPGGYEDDAAQTEGEADGHVLTAAMLQQMVATLKASNVQPTAAIVHPSALTRKFLDQIDREMATVSGLNDLLRSGLVSQQSARELLGVKDGL